MYCVHIASELAPIAKVGGLADVLLGLCRELSWKGHDIDIIIPKYDCMDSSGVRDLTIEMPDLLSFYEGNWHHNTVWIGWVENLKVYFIEPHHPRYFFNRGCFYGCEDDIERYLYFARAAMEFLFKKQLYPSIIHLHDWQTAVCALLYKEMYQPLGYNKSRLVFTIHNIDYQGKCAAADLDRIGLKGEAYLTSETLQDPMTPLTINLLKGGVIYADYITTVSPNYAEEIKTPMGGKGLDQTLMTHQDKMIGILNGIDYSYWNPEIDPHLPAHFSAREVPSHKKDRNLLDKKAYIKKVLRERLGLAESYKPIVGCVTRLVPQKGIELIIQALTYCKEHQAQFVLLGTSPIPSIHKEFHALKCHYTEDADIHLILQHQEELAHLIYAASDIFIVPSLFEPCGLTQMIALKYGSVPIVRRTGGLANTIFDVDYSTKKIEETNGYTFDDPTVAEIETVLARAFDCWFNQPDKWRHMMLRGMTSDFSWNKPSDLYLDVYKKITDKNLGKNEPC